MSEVLNVQLTVKVTNVRTGKSYEMVEDEDVTLNSESRSDVMERLLEKIVATPFDRAPVGYQEIERGE